MKVLVIGRRGQVAQAIANLAIEGVSTMGRPDVDLLVSDTIKRAVDVFEPEIILNSAAYTQVDAAETDRDAALAMNGEGPSALAQICSEANIPLLHMSTDCVFDGSKSAPFTPEDTPNPLNYYGATKLEGEQAVASILADHLIVRVSWVYSEFGSTFVRTMLKLAHTHPKLTVVSDQVGYPTHASWLAQGLLKMCEVALAPGFDAWGTYHLAGLNETNRAAQAEEIFRISREYGGPSVPVEAVLTKNYNTAACRALNARLDSRKAIDQFGLELIDWKAGHALVVPKILQEMKRA